MSRRKQKSHLGKNIVIVLAGVLVAVLLDATGVFDSILEITAEGRLISSFIAGLFFTSFLTTAPAILALGKIGAASTSLLPVALIGGLGALIGDLLIFSLVKNEIANDARNIICHSASKRIAGICTGRIFRFLTPVLGALIIASPIPDEVGLSLLGFSRVPLKIFIPLSYIMNTLGILAIGATARLLT